MIIAGRVPALASLVAAALGVGAFAAAADEYFPPQLLRSTVTCEFGGRPSPPRPIISEQEAAGYSKHLRAAAEGSLYLASKSTDRTRSYRFTWLRTFHAPVIVRVDEAADGQLRLTAKQLSGKGGYEPGEVAQRLQRPLSGEETTRFKAALAELRPFDGAPNGCDLGLDGAGWVLESAGPEGYHYVNRFSPRSGPVRDFGLLLVGFTGWSFEQVY
jgi:hypothetical protein